MAVFRKILQWVGEKARQVANKVNNIADHFKKSDELAAIKKKAAEGIEAIKKSDELAAIKEKTSEGIEAIKKSDELAAIKKKVAEGIKAIKKIM